jgi:hypothetical protein
LPNLQVINRDVHAAKCVAEARDRRVARNLPMHFKTGGVPSLESVPPKNAEALSD